MTGMHLTLRELQGMIFDKRALAISATAAFACTIAGPFGTDDAPLVSRAIYWTISIFTALVGCTAIIASMHATDRLNF